MTYNVINVSPVVDEIQVVHPILNMAPLKAEFSFIHKNRRNVVVSILVHMLLHCTQLTFISEEI